jgi:hypothetical protein
LDLRPAFLFAFAIGLGLQAPPVLACERERVALTCDAARINPGSYGLLTRGAALASAAQYDFWEQFDVDSPGRPITSANEAMAFAAQRALELDITNQMAHATSARELLVLGQPEMAEAAWHRVIENKGSVVWPATLGGRDEVLVAFDQAEMRLYTRAQVEQTMGPAPSDALWAAVAGCIDARVPAAAVVAWPNVREIQKDDKILPRRTADHRDDRRQDAAGRAPRPAAARPVSRRSGRADRGRRAGDRAPRADQARGSGEAYRAPGFELTTLNWRNLCG